jgi:signal transduction histidine kinase
LTLTNITEAYVYRWAVGGHALPGAAFAALANQVAYVVAIGGIVLIVLIYPAGRFLSGRWRAVAWALTASTAACAVGLVARAGTMNTDTNTNLTNPLAVGPRALAEALVRAGSWGLIACGLVSLAAVVVRARRASGDEREQIRWLAYAGLLGMALLLGSALVVTFVPQVQSPGYHNSFAVGLGSVLLWGGFLCCIGIGIPAAMGFAILKYRLYDIDVVIQRTLVYGALAAFITAVYVGMVVGVGALLNTRGHPNLGLSILATAVVAIAFQPVRERVQRVANRLVYGKRATPYEALADLSERMGASFAVDDVLPRMARVLAEATGASRADVWLRSRDELHVEATWPVDAPAIGRIALEAGEPATPPGIDRVAAVRHHGELLGALSFTKQRGDAVTPVEDRLISDLAAQTGLVLHNAGLSEQLLARLEELRASRQRLVGARDEERRRLERNIHDGAQQQLVALAVKVRLAGIALDRDEDQARTLLSQVRTETTEALDTLRELARGIYPPLLADRGLSAALEAQAGKSVVPVRVESNGIGRYAPDVEAAVYFCALEALQNVAKYAGATAATVRLAAANGDLRFEVADDGTGFDPSATAYGTGLQGMADRLDAAGGTLEVRSAPGAGTTVVGRVPARSLELVG